MDGGRLAEVLGALSGATDLAAGQPVGTGLTSTVLAVRIGYSLGLDPAELSRIYYACICRRIGCTSTADDVAPVALGDERALNHSLNLADLSDPHSVAASLEAGLPPGDDAAARKAAIEAVVGMGTALCHAADAHCMQAMSLTRRLPVPDGVVDLLSQIDARWDGGNPIRAAGEAIPLETRIIEFSVFVELHRRAGGLTSALEVASARAGGQFDPALSALFAENATSLTNGLMRGGEWEAYLEAEPADPVMLTAGNLRAVCLAFADFSDMKSRYFRGHSRRVAALALRAAVDEGLDESACRAIYDAGLVHDIGRAAVPNGIWNKPAPLSPHERAEAERHTFHTATILSASPVFTSIEGIASFVHERCDGSGYHRGARLAAREAALLAVANLYDEITSERPRGPRLDAATAAEKLNAEASEHRLPADCISAVLRAAGLPATPPAVHNPAGLTRREADVLRAIARGLSTKEIAADFGISPKTVDKHTENLFRKVGVSSRTAAALFAMEQDML